MDQGWFIGLLVVFLTFSGCGKSGGKWKSFPIEIYAEPAMAADMSRENDLKEAMAFWEQKAGTKLFNYKGAWGGGLPFSGESAHPGGIRANVVFSQNPWPFTQNTAGQTTTIQNSDGDIEAGIVMMNPDLAFCSGDCAFTSDQTSRRNMLTHELGHFIGLGHVNDSTNIMYPSVLLINRLEGASVDLAALHRVVGN